MAAHHAPLSLGFSRQEHWSGLPFPSPMHESEKWKWSHSVVSDSSWPHGVQPTRLLRPWDFPGKSTGVGRHCLLWVNMIKGPQIIIFLWWGRYPPDLILTRNSFSFTSLGYSMYTLSPVLYVTLSPVLYVYSVQYLIPLISNLMRNSSLLWNLKLIITFMLKIY